MRSPTCLFACVLGLLPSLSMAVQPIFSTVPPFTLNIGRFEPLLYNVTLKYLGDDIQAFVPVLTKGPTTEFKIVNGNLTTSDSSLGAYFGNTTATGLRPILFSDKVPTGVFVETADFVENTIFSPSAGYIPKIFSLNGDLVLRRNGDENPEAEGVEIFVQPKGNTDTTFFLSLTLTEVAPPAPASYSK